jgi:DNA-directed RNA polymerase subunit RPC12/RpoP
MMNIKTLWRKLLSYKDCPVCGHKATVKAVQNIVLFYDEPPMFYHWHCVKCGAETPPLPTRITEEAAKKAGIDLSKPPEDWRGE